MDFIYNEESNIHLYNNKIYFTLADVFKFKNHLAIHREAYDNIYAIYSLSPKFTNEFYDRYLIANLYNVSVETINIIWSI
tara:strand:- start:1936 stop:2175 length:240 start_codon:yes stop_codon:yes gene_type:complete